MPFNQANLVPPILPGSSFQPGDRNSSQSNIDRNPSPTSNLNLNLARHTATTAFPPSGSTVSPETPSQASTHRMHSGFIRPSQYNSLSQTHPRSPPTSQGTSQSFSLQYNDGLHRYNISSHSGFLPSAGLSPRWNGYGRNDLTPVMSNVSELGEGDGDDRRRERGRNRSGEIGTMHELASLPAVRRG